MNYAHLIEKLQTLPVEKQVEVVVKVASVLRLSRLADWLTTGDAI